MNEPSGEPPQPIARPAGRSSASSSARSTWTWILLLTFVAGGGWYAYGRFKQPAEPAEAKPAPKGSSAALSRRPPGGAIPVVGVPAQRGNLDVYLSGLGTVTPLRTVTVKTRVEGELVKLHFAEGQLVKEGQLLAEIDPRQLQAQLKQSEGQLARDQALLANARLDVERYRTLLAQDSIAKQQVDSQEALVRQYEGVVRVDQGLLDNARLQLSYTRITAPITGRTGLRLVDQGNIVRPGDASGLVVITQLDPITVLFTLPQDNLPAVLKRQQSSGAVEVEAWDRELRNRIATGALSAVDNQVDTATGTVKLKASFANAGGALFPNQFVNVRMKLDTVRGATLIPSAAIQRGSQSLFVYVVKDDKRVTARPVKLGIAEGTQTSVTEGVAPGEIVVIDGIDRLREGAEVNLTQRPEFKGTVDGASPAKKGGSRGARAGGPPPPFTPEELSSWMSMSPDEKKAKWPELKPEQKAWLREAKARREKAKAGN